MNFGHITIEKNGNKCNCGNIGCLETYASMKVLKDKIAKVKGKESLTGEDLRRILESNDRNINKIVDDFIEYLNIGFTNYINIFEPEAICIGGSFVYFEDLLLDKLNHKMHQDNRTFNKEIPKLLIAKMRK